MISFKKTPNICTECNFSVYSHVLPCLKHFKYYPVFIVKAAFGYLIPKAMTQPAAHPQLLQLDVFTYDHLSDSKRSVITSIGVFACKCYSCVEASLSTCQMQNLQPGCVVSEQLCLQATAFKCYCFVLPSTFSEKHSCFLCYVLLHRMEVVGRWLWWIVGALETRVRVHLVVTFKQKLGKDHGFGLMLISTPFLELSWTDFVFQEGIL